MLGHYIAIENVAYYGVAIYIATVIGVPARSMHQITNPLTAKLLNDNNKIELEVLYKKSSLNLFVISGFIFLLIILNIMSPTGQMFTGEGIHAVMTSAGLIHGEHKIYHYMQDNIAVFSIANAVEPGFFELSQLQSISTPGLAVFMELPGPVECRKAFDTLLEITQRLATALSGELCDENRSVLNQQSISHLKEKVDGYRIKQQAFQRRKHK